MDIVEVVAYRFVTVMAISIYIFGLIGNTLNIFVFVIWIRPRRTLNNNNNNMHQTSNSPLYLLASSCANFVEIVYPVLTRIIYDGFQNSKTKANELFTCKFRYYVLHTTDLISLTCICLATLDRYLISSRDAHLRRLSLTNKQTKLLIFLIIIISCLHNIPIGIYIVVSTNGQCLINSPIYFYYYLCVIQIFLHGIFPMCFLSIFGSLTYKQLKVVQRTNNQTILNSDKQLSRMLLFLCIAILISSLPYCIQNIYFIQLSNINSQLSSYSLLFYFISAILFFTNPAVSFYIFFFSTPNFRKQIKRIFQCKFVRRNLANNQVHTITIS